VSATCSANFSSGFKYGAVRGSAQWLVSFGTIGDAYAMAESTIGLYKIEHIGTKGPWRTIEAVELATPDYVDWFNHRRLYSEIGNVPPAEHEEHYYSQFPAATSAA